MCMFVVCRSMPHHQLTQLYTLHYDLHTLLLAHSARSTSIQTTGSHHEVLIQSQYHIGSWHQGLLYVHHDQWQVYNIGSYIF